MSNFPVNNYDRLKAFVLSSSDLPAVLPPNCGLLKQLIFDKTQISLSLESLMQVYGQKASLFHPSLFTLNTLALYCGVGSWEEWCLQCDTANGSGGS